MIKIILLFFILALFYSNKSFGQEDTSSIYFANCDSIYYSNTKEFTSSNVKKSKINDSVFIKQLVSYIVKGNKNVKLKPMTSLCSQEDGIAPFLLNWFAFLKQNKIGYQVSFTDSLENYFFNAISLKEDMLNHNKISPPPPPPPPPPLSDFTIRNPKALTILIGGGDKFYYYNGGNCSKLTLTNFKSLTQIIKTRIKTTKRSEIIIVIKATEQATFKNSIDILDEIAKNNAPKYSYAEEDITQAELNCIKNYKKKK